jgi:hypothetical protein
MSDTATTVMGEAREAWQRIRRSTVASWDNWLSVSRTLVIARQAAMTLVKINKAFGRRDSAVMRQWLETNGLADITGQERYRAIRFIELGSGHEELLPVNRAPPLGFELLHRDELRVGRVALGELDPIHGADRSADDEVGTEPEAGVETLDRAHLKRTQGTTTTETQRLGHAVPSR